MNIEHYLTKFNISKREFAKMADYDTPQGLWAALKSERMRTFLYPFLLKILLERKGINLEKLLDSLTQEENITATKLEDKTLNQILIFLNKHGLRPHKCSEFAIAVDGLILGLQSHIYGGRWVIVESSFDKEYQCYARWNLSKTTFKEQNSHIKGLILELTKKNNE